MTATTYQKAIKLLARRSHSRCELENKLLRSSDRSTVKEVLDRLVSAGYLDDSRYAWERADYLRRHKHWGNHRIQLDLRRRGVDAKIVHHALTQLEREHPELSALRRVILSRIERSGTPETLSEVKKVFDRCIRLGYPPAMVRNELELYFNNLDWEE